MLKFQTTSKDWVLRLADDLTKYGVYILLDQYDIAVGKSLTAFMAQSIEAADKVLVIMTPEYKIKASQQRGGVGYEHSIISAELYNIQSNNKKFIPVLRIGNVSTSAPGFLRALVYHNMIDNEQYESSLLKLVREIYDKPEIKRPELGQVPNFDTLKLDPIIEIALNKKSKVDAEYKRIDFLNSEDGVKDSIKSINSLFESIINKAEHYKTATGFFFRADTDYQELGLRGEGGSGIYMNWKYRIKNYTSGNILLVKFYENFPFEWSGSRFSSHQRNISEDIRTEYEFDISLDLTIYGWRQVDTEDTFLTNEQLESTMFKWILAKISDYKDREIRKQRFR